MMPAEQRQPRASNGAQPDKSRVTMYPEPASSGKFSLMGSGTQSMGRTSTSQSVLNMVNCILGAGVLGYPYCFKASGMLLASLIMLVCVAACRFSYQLLLYSSQLSSRRTYEQLAQQAVGRWGRHVVDLCTAALNLGSIVAYLNILADVLSSVAGTLIPPGAEPSRSTFITGVTLFAALPVGLIVRDHQVVATFSTASVGFIVLFALVVVGVACFPLQAAAAAAPLHVWKLDGLLVAFPVMAYSFTAHPYYLGIYNNLASASPKRMLHVTDLAMLLAGGLYWVVGLSGYLAFKNRTAGDLLRNFGGAQHRGIRGAYERAIKLCYGLSILGSIPLVIMPFYNLLLPWVGWKHPEPMVDRLSKHRMSDDEAEDIDMTGSVVRVKAAGVLPTLSSAASPGRYSMDSRQYNSAVGGSSTGAGALSPGHSSRLAPAGSMALPTDVVDIKLHHDGIHGAHSHDEDVLPSVTQHTLVVCSVLGLAMLSAIYLPNVEFIFGLTGATASVLISFIMPAITFIRLLDAHPHLTSPVQGHVFVGGHGGASVEDGEGWGQGSHDHNASTPSKAMMSDEVRQRWVWRRRSAVALLLFGVLAGIACTDAILGAVREEAAVVTLAQHLVAHELVVDEANRAHVKAMDAATTVRAVAAAGTQLNWAYGNATTSILQLQAAANHLAAIDSAAAQRSEKPPSWDFTGLFKVRHGASRTRQTATNIAANVSHVMQCMDNTRNAVMQVVTQLDSTLILLQQQHTANSSTALQQQQQAGQLQLPGGLLPGAPSGMPVAVQAQSLAEKLTQALEEHQQQLAASNQATRVKPGALLSQVRTNAITALAAVDQSSSLLQQALAKVQHLHRTHSRDAAVAQRHAALEAIQAAQQAVSTCLVALQLTRDSLAVSADSETQALLPLVNQVVMDLQKAKKQGGSSGSAGGTNTARSPESGGTSNAPGSFAPVAGSTNNAVVGSTGSTGSGGTQAGTLQRPDDPGGKPPDAVQGVVSTASSPDAVTDVVTPAPTLAAVQPGTADGTTTSSGAATATSSTAGALQNAVNNLREAGQASNATSNNAQPTGAAGMPGTGQAPMVADGADVKAVGGGSLVTQQPGVTGTAGDHAGGDHMSSTFGSIGSGTDSPGAADMLATAGQQGQANQTMTAGSTAGGTAGSTAGDIAGSTVSSTPGGTGGSIAVQQANGTSQMGDAEVAAVAEVLKDLAHVVEGTQANVIAQMTDELAKADTKVAERVVDMLQDLANSKTGMGGKARRVEDPDDLQDTQQAGGVNSGIAMTTRMAEVVHGQQQQQQTPSQQQQQTPLQQQVPTFAQQQVPLQQQQQQVASETQQGAANAGPVSNNQIPAGSDRNQGGPTDTLFKAQEGLGRKFGTG